MKIVLVDWCHGWVGAAPQPIKPMVLDLDNPKVLQFLLVALGTGHFDDICVEVDSVTTYECVQKMFTGTGAAERVASDPVAERSPVFRSGYEIYTQRPDAYFFLNPAPRPNLFLENGLTSYTAEFA